MGGGPQDRARREDRKRGERRYVCAAEVLLPRREQAGGRGATQERDRVRTL